MITTSGGAENVYYYLDLYNNTSGAVAATGAVQLNAISNAKSYQGFTVALAFAGLNIGQSYSIRLWGYQADGSYAVITATISIEGICS